MSRRLLVHPNAWAHFVSTLTTRDGTGRPRSNKCTGISPVPRTRQPASCCPISIARVERRLVNRRLPVRLLVEQKDREVGDDQRDIGDREPAGRNAIGVRDHASSRREPSPALTAAPGCRTGCHLGRRPAQPAPTCTSCADSIRALRPRRSAHRCPRTTWSPHGTHNVGTAGCDR